MKRLFIFLLLFLNLHIDTSYANTIEELASNLRSLKGKLSDLSFKISELLEKQKESEQDQYDPLLAFRTDEELEQLEPTKNQKFLQALPFFNLTEEGIRKEFTSNLNTIKRINVFRKKLKQYNQVSFSGDLLEYFLAANSNQEFDQLVSKVKKFRYENKIRDKLAKKWIRNAATRIFHDDLRSFLELVVNACDAMLPQEQSVGKFGMGFFSILSLLNYEETNGCALTISTHHKEYGKSDAYTMQFDKISTHPNSWTDADIKINFSWLPEEETPTDTGTIITLEPKTGTFSQATISTLRKYVHYLDTKENIAIKLSYQLSEHTNLQEEIIGAQAHEQDIPTIEVILKPKILSVKDTGSGIRLETTLYNLLIPSSSSKGKKTLHTLRQQAFENEINVPKMLPIQAMPGQEDLESSFIISVNGITVVSWPLDSKIVDENGNTLNLIVPMPQATQLTLARNELSITPDGNSFEEQYLKKMIDHTIEQVFSRSIDPTILPVLFLGLKKWENQTAANHLQGLFSNYLRTSLTDKLKQDSTIIPVPAKYYSNFKKIIFPPSQKKLVPVNGELVNYNFETLALFLQKSLKSTSITDIDQLKRKGIKQGILTGHSVYFVPDNALKLKPDASATISTLGLKNTLFAPESIIKNITSLSEGIKKVINYISSQFTQYKVVPAKEFSESTHKYPIPIIIGSKGLSSRPTSLSLFLNPDDNKTFFTENNKQFLKEFFSQKEILNTLIYDYNIAAKTHGGTNNSTVLKLFKSPLVYPIIEETTTGIDHSLIPSKIYRQPNVHILFIKSAGDIQVFTFENGRKLIKLIKQYNATILTKDTKTILSDLNNKQKLEKFGGKKRSLTDLANIILAGIRQKYKDVPLYLAFSDKSRKIERFFPFEKTIEKFNSFFFTILTHQYNLQEKMSTSNKLKNEIIETITGKIIPRNYGMFDKNRLPLYLTLENVPEDTLEQIFSNITTQYLTLHKYQQTLKFSIPNLSLDQQIFPLLTIKELLKIGTNKFISESISNMVETCMSIYDKYLSIPDEEFRREYGKKSYIFTSQIYKRISINDIISYLNSVGTNKKTLDKLVKLQISDLLYFTNPLRRSKELKEKMFDVPTILAENPIAYLSEIYKRSNDINLCNRILNLVKTPPELAVLSISLLRESNLLRKESEQNKKIENLLPVLVSELIRNKIDRKKLHSIYDTKDKYAHEINSILEYIKDSITDNPTFKLNMSPLQESVVRNIKNAPAFTLTQLMKAHVRNEGLLGNLTENNLEEVVKKATSITNPVDVGKITQAIEAGSEKKPIEASITESLQNSIDAIKQFFNNLEQDNSNSMRSYSKRLDLKKASVEEEISLLHKASTIEYYLEKNPGKNSTYQSVSLTMQDYIGMPNLKVLLTDLIIPDYSSKSPAKGNIGDMGNGTFKLYQNAQKVTFTTRLTFDPEKIYMLHVKPLRNKDNQVYDMELKAIDLSSDVAFKDFFGTKINIIFQEESSKNIDMSLLATKNFLLSSCATTNVKLSTSLPKHKSAYEGFIKLNLIEPDNQPLNTQVKSKDLLFEYNDNNKTLFSSHLRSNQKLDSFVTTGGVPFRSLKEIASSLNLLPTNFLNLASTGIVIDLKPGSYEPVQSRTLLKLKKGILPHLKKFLIETLYLSELEQKHKQLSEDISGEFDTLIVTDYFTHLNSPVKDFSQLRLSSHTNQEFQKNLQAFIDTTQTIEHWDKETFFTYYKPISTEHAELRSFYDFIELAFTKDTLLKKLNIQFFQKTIKKTSQDWIEKTQSNINPELTDDEKEKFVEEWKELLRSKQNEINEMAKNSSRIWLEKNLSKNIFELEVLYQFVSQWFANKLSYGNFVQIPSQSELLQAIPDLRKSREKKEFLIQRKKIETIKTTIKDLSTIKHLINKALSIYCKLIIPKLPDDCGVFYFEINDPTLGFWNGNKININLSPLSISDLLSLLVTLYEGAIADVVSNDFFDTYFNFAPGHTPTIIHELEHAYRDKLHTEEGTHTPGKTAYGKTAQFDVCANSRVGYARINNNLLVEWAKQFRATTNQKLITEIKKQITTISEIESIDKLELAKKLGF